MLMSKSRLEKFLYALYSLDSSDLPNPLSRIEELYKCWVTGEEAPTFEPLSRVEKYLMAILGAYNVDELPNPLSRVEVLLHKLATGDDNLDDVESFLSEHEELLAEIIRNGGAGGNIDIEYILYTLSTEHNTLYNTAEKPVKSAILKGNTLVNIVKKQEKPFSHSVGSPMQNNNLSLNTSLKANTLYTRFIHVSTLDLGTTYQVGMYDALMGDDGSYNQYSYTINSTGWLINTLTTKTTSVSPYMINPDTNALSNGLIHIEIDKFMIIEGDHTQEDIPYFEGMKSVENPAVTITGKNLFDVSRLPQTVNIIPTSKGYTLKGYSCGTGMLMSEMFPNLIVGKKYVFSFQSSSSSATNAQNSIGFYNTNTDELIFYRNNESFTLTNEMYYERRVILYGVGGETTEFSNVQLEEGSVATEYEPYKPTTVSCNEDVELRGIGDIQDELNLLTGELAQRIGEVVLDGSESWTKHSAYSTDEINVYWTHNKFIPSNSKATEIVCDKLTVSSPTVPNSIRTNGEGGIFIRLPSEVNITSFLQSDPVTVHYKLATESVKTVDISVADQDGNDTELKSFDDITYVTLSSEGPIPEAEMEVATKNEEVLYTMSLRMDDIYAAQTTLEGTSNTQRENIDTTMIATTEIYEGLL